MTCKQVTLQIFIKWMLNKDVDEPRKNFSPIVSMKLKCVRLTFSFIFFLKYLRL